MKGVRVTKYLKRIIYLASVLYGLACLGLLLILRPAAPGPSEQAIWGVGIGSYDAPEGIAYLSGQRLRCAPATAPGPFTTTCTVDIEGKTLQIDAARDTTGAGDVMGVCEARYDGRSWPCSVSLRHAHIPWFAYISPSLGLDARQMQHLRDQHAIENLPEAPFQILTLVSSLLIALGAGLVMGFRHRQLRGRTVAALALGFVVALLSFYGNAFLMMKITGGFWD